MRVKIGRPDEADRQKPGDCRGERNPGMVEQSDRHEAKDKRSVVPEPVILVDNKQQDDKSPDGVPFHGNNNTGGSESWASGVLQ